MILEKIKNFFKLDFRWKLIKAGEILKLNLYPKYFKKFGLKGLYSKIIFYFIFYEKIKKLRIKNYNAIFCNVEQQNKFNVLISLPRSASNFLRNLIKSYTEITYKVNNGVPKYDGVMDRWRSAVSPLVSGDMYNAIDLDDQYLKIKELITKEEFEKKKIVFSRHPLQTLDLYNLELIKPVLLIRDPIEQIYSWYVTNTFSYNKSEKTEINYHKIDYMIRANLNFYSYWKNFLDGKERNLDYLMITFNELQKKSETSFIKILRFYDYNLNIDIVRKIISINTKENYKSYMGEYTTNSVRFLRKDMIKDFSNSIKKYINSNSSANQCLDIYNLFK